MEDTLRSMILVLLVAVAGIGLGCSAPDSFDSTAPAATSSADGADSSGILPILREPDAFVRTRKLAVLLPTLGPESIPEIREVLRRRRRDMGWGDFELLVRRWAMLDPKGATEWALGVEAARHRTVALHMAVEIWAQQDPAAAREGIAEATHSVLTDVAESAQQALVRGWFQSDRPGLEAYIQGLGAGPLQTRSLSRFTLSLADAEGSDGLVAWAESVPETDPAYKRTVYAMTTAALISTDPEAVERWCEAQCNGAYGGAEMRSLVARSRLMQGVDEASVLDWLVSAPDGEIDPKVLVDTYAIWAKKQRQPALDWMAEKVADGAPPWAPALYATYAEQLAATQPAQAAAWTQRIPDAFERENAVVAVVRQWLGQNPQAAEAWLSQASVSERGRQRIHAGMPTSPSPAAGAPAAEPASEPKAP